MVKQMVDVKLYLDEVGKRIMERRKKLGLTQEALAEMSDLTTQFVSYAESGKQQISVNASGKPDENCSSA